MKPLVLKHLSLTSLAGFARRSLRQGVVLRLLCLGLAVAFTLKAEFSLVFPHRLDTAENACEFDTSFEEFEEAGSQGEVDFVSSEASLDDFSVKSMLAARLPVASRLLRMKSQHRCALLLRGPPLDA